jgi:serine/threonine protein kinase
MPRAHEAEPPACDLYRRFFKKSEISKNYVFGDTLGSGNFATVKRAQYKGKEKIEAMPEDVAVKIIDKSKVEDMNDIQVRVGAFRCSGSVAARKRRVGHWRSRLPPTASTQSRLFRSAAARRRRALA